MSAGGGEAAPRLRPTGRRPDRRAGGRTGSGPRYGSCDAHRGPPRGQAELRRSPALLALQRSGFPPPLGPGAVSPRADGATRSLPALRSTGHRAWPAVTGTPCGSASPEPRPVLSAPSARGLVRSPSCRSQATSGPRSSAWATAGRREAGDGDACGARAPRGDPRGLHVAARSALQGSRAPTAAEAPARLRPDGGAALPPSLSPRRGQLPPPPAAPASRAPRSGQGP